MKMWSHNIQINLFQKSWRKTNCRNDDDKDENFNSNVDNNNDSDDDNTMVTLFYF